MGWREMLISDKKIECDKLVELIKNYLKHYRIFLLPIIFRTECFMFQHIVIFDKISDSDPDNPYGNIRSRMKCLGYFNSYTAIKTAYRIFRILGSKLKFGIFLSRPPLMIGISIERRKKRPIRIIRKYKIWLYKTPVKCKRYMY
jgi:hypothetical protein